MEELIGDVLRKRGIESLIQTAVQMPTIFLSHSFLDAKLARSVQICLKNSGIKCWVAPGAITPGKRWTACLTTAIEDADIFVLLLTARSNTSSHVQRELDVATSRQKRILPVVIGDFKIDRGIEYAIAGIQRMLLSSRGVQANSAKVTTAVKNLLKRGGSTSNPSVPPVSTFASTNRIRKPQNISNGFVVDYMRLHGAVEVPLLMDLIGSDNGFSSWTGNDERNPTFYHVEGAASVASRDLVRFWKREWRYKKARPLLNPLWQEISGNKELEHFK